MSSGFDDIELTPTRDSDKVGEQIARTPPGNYHVALADFQAFGGKDGQHIATFEVLASTNENAVGSQHRETFWSKASAKFPEDDSWSDRLFKLALVLGLTTRGQIQAAKNKGEALNFRFSDGVGRQCFIGLATRKTDAGEFQCIADRGYAIFDLSDDHCKDWPRNQKMIEYDRQLRENPSGINPADLFD